jgi:hypothetical protein
MNLSGRSIPKKKTGKTRQGVRISHISTRYLRLYAFSEMQVGVKYIQEDYLLGCRDTRTFSEVLESSLVHMTRVCEAEIERQPNVFVSSVQGTAGRRWRRSVKLAEMITV